MELHRGAGNRAVADLFRRALQRDVGWKDASTQGHAWNLDERSVGKIRRIPLEGLSEGLGENRVWDVKAKKWRVVSESPEIPVLSSESAKGKAIVLVPDGLDAKKKIEVLVFLHGFTEYGGRPYAGWRTLTDPPKGMKREETERLKRLRQGADSQDSAPVRDVALDQAEQQLEESGDTQLVIVLPQGGLHSQFGKDGDQNFDAGPYVAEIVSRLLTEKRWRDAGGKPVTTAPTVSRIDMAGHSGAGATLAHMADAKQPSSALTGDLVIYDAINRGQLSSFVTWAGKRLDADLAVLTGTATDDQKFEYLRGAQKLRGYTTDSYISAYIELDDAIGRWFTRNRAKLGAWAPCLRANYTMEYVDVAHEELMRGSKAGQARPAGTGTILDAIKGLHPALLTSTTTCPAMPKPLSQRFRERKLQEERERDEQRKAAKNRKPR
jgi:hypothetical protein